MENTMTNIVLAGGSGTRFWPLSRRERPKQLIRLWGEQTMIEQTVDRLRTAAPEGALLVVCGEHLLDATRDVLDEQPGLQFLVEPEARNTLPAIALAAIAAFETNGDEPTSVFPADHYIGDLDAFSACLTAAEREARNGHIVTMGIEPTRPETGYGYIHYDPETTLGAEAGRIGAHPVEEFVEKPDRSTAEEYLQSGEFAWNSGMFCFKPSTLFEEIRRQLPEMHRQLERIRDAWDQADRRDVVADAFSSMEPVSIDYGVMEGAEDVVVIPASFRWSDVGHWAAVDQVREPDDDGNIVDADTALVDVQNSVFYSDDDRRLIAAAGVEDLVVVDTEDALLVVPKERAQSVRALVDLLEDRDRDDLL